LDSATLAWIAHHNRMQHHRFRAAAMVMAID
jgi:hypothetical protein